MKEYIITIETTDGWHQSIRYKSKNFVKALTILTEAISNLVKEEKISLDEIVSVTLFDGEKILKEG